MSPSKYIKKKKPRRRRVFDPFGFDPAVGLHYTSDADPGIRRMGVGRNFRYLALDGSLMRDKPILARIKALDIPTSWHAVWVSPLPNGHLQASGRDSSRRRGTIFHPRWHEVREQNEFDRLPAFVAALPAIRERVAQDLALPGTLRNKVLATIVRLLETLYFPGSNGDRTERESGGEVRFLFPGRSKPRETTRLDHGRLAHAVRSLMDLPGNELVQVVGEDGTRYRIDTAAVSDYLGEITGQGFTTKDFRSWAATRLVYARLLQCKPFTDEAQAKRNLLAAITAVGRLLARSPTIVRRGYCHAAIPERYLQGGLVQPVAASGVQDAFGLQPDELAIYALIQPYDVDELEPASNAAGESNAPEHA